MDGFAGTAGEERWCSDELQIQIDDVYACPGTCAGCALTIDERKVTRPDMAPETLALTFRRLREYVPTVAGVRRVNLTYAIADHLTMPDEHLELLYREAASFLSDLSLDGSSGVFFSTSLVGRPDRVLPRLEFLSSLGSDFSFLPVAVLDPAKLRDPRYGPDYAFLVAEAKRLFGAVDLTLNLSNDAVATFPPEEFHAYAVSSGFRDVTINWTPNLENLSRTTGDVGALADWLIRYDSAASASDGPESSFGPVARKALAFAERARASGDDCGIAAAAAAVVPGTIGKSIEIDHLGSLLAKFEAVGDVPHAPRFGYPTLGSLRDGSIRELLDAGASRLVSSVARTHASCSACMSCEWAIACAATGYHVYTAMLSGKRGRGASKGSGCPHVAATLFEAFSSGAGRSR